VRQRVRCGFRPPVDRRTNFRPAEIETRQIAICSGVVESRLGLPLLRIDYFKLSLRRTKCRSHLEISGTRFLISRIGLLERGDQKQALQSKRWIGDLVETLHNQDCCIHLMASDNPKMTFVMRIAQAPRRL
jgi:hypothetical protein